MSGGDGADVASSDERALSVLDAAQETPDGERVAVRGFVFVDAEAGEVLCATRQGDPLACGGPALRLDHLDVGRLDRVEATEPGWDAWSDDDVVLVGRLAAGTLDVEDVL
jgi:hypothetical protein